MTRGSQAQVANPTQVQAGARGQGKIEVARQVGNTIKTIEKGVTITSLFGDIMLVNGVYCHCPLEV
ncbi:hypothetical protein EPI10_031469 [Gossypium australe]|uniref:Uncharacterized protein n=1 Tax=Gossypium australe TaxID=47621 RepID=A0A5B6X3U0_9ROSI|nr:hypothetical protein EPI10_031469 [Gossypium australe]